MGIVLQKYMIESFSYFANLISAYCCQFFSLHEVADILQLLTDLLYAINSFMSMHDTSILTTYSLFTQPILRICSMLI